MRTAMISIRSTVLLGLTVGLLGLTGCSTARRAGDQEWMDLFSPRSGEEVATYDRDRIDRDYARLLSLTRELDALSDDMATMRRSLVFKDTPYLSDEENKAVELLLFRFSNARDALWDMVHYYRGSKASDAATHTRGSILGMSAGLTLSSSSSRFVALFQGDKHLTKLFNTPHPSYDIPKGMFDTVYDGVTSLDTLKILDVAWYLFCKELADPESELSKLRTLDHAYGRLIDALDGLHADTHINTEYVLLSQAHSLAGFRNRLHHSHIAAIGDGIGGALGSGLYKTRGVVFRDVARIKNPTAKLLQFSEEQVREVKALLQPGDIALTYTAGYMSNVFLPGKFKHGITYLGSVEDRRRVGLTNAWLASQSASDEQRDALLRNVAREVTTDGHAIDIIEAVAEGVIMNSLDKLLATHINRLVVIRPRLSAEERRAHLLDQLRYLGTSYDFKFDFQDNTYQCCTELVYRTLNGKGPIEFPLVAMKGRWILAADDILRYYLIQNREAFELILLADHGADPGNHKAMIHTGDKGLTRLVALMGVATAADSD